MSEAYESIAPYLDRLAVWRGYEADLTSLSIVALGITFYTLVIFAFYRNLSLRQPFHSQWGKGRTWGKLVKATESVLVFPVTSFLFFLVLAASLFFPAKPTTTTYQILLFAMAIVASVRLVAFVNQDASGDLAKLLPLSLLAVVVIDPSYLTWDAVWARYKEVPSLVPVLGRFFLLFLVLETGVRVARAGYEKTTALLRRRRETPAVAAAVEEPMEALDSVHADVPMTSVEVTVPEAPVAPKQI